MLVSLDHVRQKSIALENEMQLLRQQLHVTESRLKMAQLEADRHIWEETRKLREAKEKEEQEKAETERKAAVEESRRKMTELLAEEARAAEKARTEKQRKDREEAVRKALEKAERQRKQREEAERKAESLREREEQAEAERNMQRKAEKRRQRWEEATQREEARCRDRDQTFRGQGPWSNRKAFQRFQAVMEELESTKFSESQPLTSGAIPWPLLGDPYNFKREDVEWATAETFFTTIRVNPGMEMKEYKDLIARVHRMFHPDRWGARGILQTVLDEEMRDALQKAGSVVSQAVTPLWTQSKSW